MHRDSMERLRLDKRLIRRRGWIAPQELSKELESLPDVSHKAAPQNEGSAETEETPPAEPEPGAP